MGRGTWYTFGVRFCMLLLIAGCSDYDVTRSQVSDTFTQADASGGVDILWVMDNSGTMYEEQASLDEHAEAFVTILATYSVDFHLGVIDTDMTDDAPGTLLGGALSADAGDLLDGFRGAIEEAGVDGSRDERGFDAAIAGADPAGANTDFARADAALEVIFYADEDDHSTASVDETIGLLQSNRAGESVTINTVVGDLPSGCFSQAAAADPGVRYIDAQTATEGMAASICTADLDALLSRLALHALGLEDTFKLSAIPLVKTMTVQVDGAAVWPRERNGWHYDPAANTVVFDGFAVPPPGAGIEIRYFDWVNGAVSDTGTGG